MSEPRATIPRADVLTDIRRVKDELDHTPTVREYYDAGHYSKWTIDKHFGSWAKALVAAGVPLTQKQRTHAHLAEYGGETIATDVRRVADEIDGALTQRDYDRHGEYAADTAKRHLGDGSWLRVLEAVGLEPTEEQIRNSHQGTVPTERLVADLERVCDELGRAVTQDEYEARGEYSASSLNRRFDAWSAAIHEAGYEPNGAQQSFGARSLLKAADPDDYPKVDGD